MNIKTNLLQEKFSFVDSTKKENTYFKIFIVLFVIIISLFFFILLFKNLNEQYFFFRTNIQNR